MLKKILTIAILVPSPAWSCHHFSRWYYHQPQRCGIETAALELKYEERYEQKYIPKQIIQPSPDQNIDLLQDYISLLNVLLNTTSSYKTTIPNIPVDILFEQERAMGIKSIKLKMQSK